LVAGFLYYDARGDDARVALTLAKTAALRYDAQVATYVRALDVTKNAEGRVVAVRARDELSGDEFDITTVSVVNATGVWADDVFTLPSHHARQRRARECRS
jgi:glycerol-3-phosphate dehydrogenase